MTDLTRITIPQALAAHVPQGEVVDFPYRLGESPQEAAERRERVLAARTRQWRASVPVRFHDAALTGLTAEQDPQGVVSRWWGSPEVLTLVLHSTEPGVGKSYTAYAVGNAAVGQGAWGRSWTMTGLNEAMRPGNDDDAFATACECDLLVLDDLGRERISEWTLERFQMVLDTRWSAQRRTVMTTNLTGQTIVERYGDPILDRLRDDAWKVEVKGKSRRAAAPW